MTQEEKNLLLKDLCGRLPYVTYVRIIDPTCLDKHESVTEGCVGGYSNTRMCQDYSMDEIFEFIESGDTVKPYLRPMSSMTEVEKIELKEYLGAEEVGCEGFDYIEGGTLEDYVSEIPYSLCTYVIDWLNAHHFDYRVMIEKELAIEAPENMYEIN